MMKPETRKKRTEKEVFVSPLSRTAILKKICLVSVFFLLFPQIACDFNSPKAYYTFIIDTSEPLDPTASSELNKFINKKVFDDIPNEYGSDTVLEFVEICDPYTTNNSFSVALDAGEGLYPKSGMEKNGPVALKQKVNFMNKNPKVYKFLYELVKTDYHNKPDRPGIASPVYDVLFSTMSRVSRGRKIQKFIIVSDFQDNFIPGFNTQGVEFNKDLIKDRYARFQKFLDPSVEIHVWAIGRRNDPETSSNSIKTAAWLFGIQPEGGFLYKTSPKLTPIFDQINISKPN